MFGDGQFFSPDGRANFMAVTPSLLGGVTEDFPLKLNTGRIRDHWHTMTRTGRSPRNSGHIAEPYCEIHPEDALAYGVRDTMLVDVASHLATVRLRAFITSRQQRGSVFAPIHWTDQFASSARIDRLVPASTDPYSGQPASKNARIKITPASVGYFGFAICEDEPDGLEGLSYWAKARCVGGWRLEFAAEDKAAIDTLELKLGTNGSPVHYEDVSSKQSRKAWFDGRALRAALFVALEPVAVSRTWATEKLTNSFENTAEKLRVLAGRPGQDQSDRGAIICSCMGVGINEIRYAVSQGCSTVSEIGKMCGAGTNCGSCKSEIGGILDELAVIAAE